MAYRSGRCADAHYGGVGGGLRIGRESKVVEIGVPWGKSGTVGVGIADIFATRNSLDCCAGEAGVGGGEIPRIDGDVAGYGPSSFCGEAAVVLATVKDARRRFAVAFGHP